MNHKSLSIYHCRLVGRVLMWHAFSRRWVWVRLPSNIVKNHHQASLKFGFLKTSWYKSTTEKHSHGALTWIPSSSSRDSSLAIGASRADLNSQASPMPMPHSELPLESSLLEPCQLWPSSEIWIKIKNLYDVPHSAKAPVSSPFATTISGQNRFLNRFEQVRWRRRSICRHREQFY